MKNEITRLEGKLEGEIETAVDIAACMMKAMLASGKSGLWAKEMLGDFERSVLKVNKIRRKLKKLGGVYQ
jgi:hypothetical protein